MLVNDLNKMLMRKPFVGLWALYVLLGIYGIILSWFLYIGPFCTLLTTKAIAKKHQRIVVTLTTTPYRIVKLKPTLDSLLQQSIKPDCIYLNIPFFFKRDNIPYVIPEWLQKYPGITIRRTDDYGPITKLLPVLVSETDPETIIITVDDDVWYPRHVVRDLVQYALQHPHAVVTPLNINFTINDKLQFTNIKYKFKHGSKASLVVGAAGVAYRRSFFANDFQPFVTKLPTQCFLTDDLVLSIYLAQHNINIEQNIKRSFNPLIVPLTYKELPQHATADALSFGQGEFSGNQERYSQCLGALPVGGFS